ncbi:MAG: type II secretion system F family protein [Clostridia bacterium]|jgi:tight adherence protein B|nr:type II secretion system F family protein [Clostridia bacterium]MCI2000688.1 type II secretion system F family protein [Clostridia bacterium]MCI2015239.1 type II secretion system F family protein [Clostridia bacterium]
MLLYIIIFMTAVTIYFLILSFKKPSEKEVVGDRIKKYLDTESVSDVQEKFFAENRETIKKKKNRKFKIESKELGDYLLMSGIKLRASEFIYIWLACTYVPILVTFFLGASVVTSIAAAIIGFCIPPFFVRKAWKKRQQEFIRQLGEALVIMSNCIKAGFSFLQAMESIAEDMQPPISTEFSRTIREMRFGVTKNVALNHMVERVKNDDLGLLVSAVMTSEQVGGNLSEILDTISDTIKDRIRIKQEVRVLTAQGRMSGIVIGLLPVFIILFLMILNPDYFISFFESLIGKIMLGISVFMELIGFFIINKIVDIEY